MKIIDRHLLRSFAVPLAYCLAAFTMVYVVFDLFNNLTDFVTGKAPFLSVMKFYAMIIPSALVFIFPVSLLLALLYSLSSLTKHNEFTAMRACGVGLLRLMLPFLGVGLAASLFVGLVNETAGPWSAYWTRQFLRSQDDDDKMEVYRAHNLPYKNELANRTWLIGTFDTRSNRMERVEVIQRRADGMDETKIVAESAAWLDGRWWFRGVIVQPYDEYGNPRGVPRREVGREMVELTEPPEVFLDEVKLHELKEPAYLSALDLLDYIRGHATLSQEAVRRYFVDLHSRLAMPWTCLVVTLLGIPFGHHTGRRGAFLGAVLAIGSFFGLYVMINLGLWLGKEGYIAPWLAGWGPNVLFAAVGGALVVRLR